MSSIATPAVDAPRPPAVHPPSPVLVLSIVALHVPLALAMHASPALARGQAVLAIAAVLWTLAAARSPGPIVVDRAMLFTY